MMPRVTTIAMETIIIAIYGMRSANSRRYLLGGGLGLWLGIAV